MKARNKTKSVKIPVEQQVFEAIVRKTTTPSISVPKAIVKEGFKPGTPIEIQMQDGSIVVKRVQTITPASTPDPRAIFEAWLERRYPAWEDMTTDEILQRHQEYIAEEQQPTFFEEVTP